MKRLSKTSEVWCLSSYFERKTRVSSNPVERIRIVINKDRLDVVSVYQIRVQERLDDEWSDWLEGTTIENSSDRTMLTSQAIDQPALRGILNRMWDLNLTVLSVDRIK